MRNILLVVGAVLLLSACGKDKTCRCSVPNDDMTHVFTIKGNCADVNVMEYWDAHDVARIDTLFCAELED